MIVDIRHLMAKGKTKELVFKISCYVHAMMVQRKPVDRVVITPQQHDSLKRLASRYGDRVVLCCGDAIVYYNHDPIDEREPEFVPVYKFDAGLPPVAANPFGIAAPPPKAPDRLGDVGLDDDDIPF